MQHQKIFFFITLFSIFTCKCIVAGNPVTGEIQNLIERVLPEKSGNFKIEPLLSESGQDVFEIDRSGQSIVLRGNNVQSLAMAFNTYLKEVVLLSYDWQADAPLKAPQKLPLPAHKTRRVCMVQERFFNNTCTFGYSFPYWNFERWERFIDWMAMNGINRPLMLAGQEAVWLRVWKSFGMTEEQICNYFSGPAHLPWHRMANMDKWGGPLPIAYIESQEALQKQLLSRCRSLGMRPVLSAFAGHVPPELRTLFPKTKINVIKPGWGGMDSIYTTCYLNPEEPLFAEIQKRFIRVQQELYGTDHLYSADPFNEITPPSWDENYLASVGKSIYESMAKADPKAIWYQMSWTFFYDSKHWTQPRLAAMVNAVPKGKLIFLDYTCEEVEYFRQSDSFHGAPFIWCYLGNFGGNTHLVAPVHKVVDRLNNVFSEKGCVGVGSTLEGINANPMIYETVLETPWLNRQERNVKQIIEKYADRRAGRVDQAVRKAWQTMTEKVFVDSAVGIWTHSTIYQVCPLLDIKQKHWTTDPAIPYKNEDLLTSILQLLQAGKDSKEASSYQFDLVNFTRQLLGNYGMVLYQEMISAYNKKEISHFKDTSRKFIELGEDIDRLLATRQEFLLGRWLADAAQNGRTNTEKAYYKRNAREIITTWHKGGGELTDYSNRQWNGLMRTYYLQRWKEFIARLDKSLENDTTFNQSEFNIWCGRFEQDWVDHTDEEFRATPKAGAITTASALVMKYKDQIMKAL